MASTNENRRIDLVQRGRPSQDSWRRSRDENLAPRGSGRLFRLFIGTVCAKRGRRVPSLPHLFSVFWPESKRQRHPHTYRFISRTTAVLTRLYHTDAFEWRSYVRTPTHARAVTGLRITSSRLRASFADHASQMHSHSRVHTHNVNESARSVRLDVAH